jgi:hypothetical protein
MSVYAKQPTNVNVLEVVGDQVGIGTESPTEKLEVAGNIKASGSLIADGAVISGSNVLTTANLTEIKNFSIAMAIALS